MPKAKALQNPQDWQAYEKEIINIHRKRHGVINVWEWGQNNSPPELVLEKAGYINSYNEIRLKRLLAKNNGNLRDCGFDFLALECVDEGTQIYCGGQAKYYTDKVTANNLGTFLMYQMNLRAKNPQSISYLYTSSKLQEDLQDNVKNPALGIRHILHPWKPANSIVDQTPVSTLEECDYALYDYQKELLDEMKTGSGLLGLYIPCGLGKTVIAGHHLRERNTAFIVAIAPLKASVTNLQDRLTCFFKGHKSLLVDSDYGGTTDIDIVTTFINQVGNKIIYTTFDSAVAVLSKIEYDFTNAYILGDEIHNALGKEELCEFINGFTNGLLMSATMPEEVSIDGIVKSISEIIEIGDVYSRSFAFAIERGLIVDYSLWLPHQVKGADGTNGVAIDIPVEFESYDRDLCAKALYLASGMLKTGSRRCIVYLVSQDECDRFNAVAKDVFLKYHGLDLWVGKIVSDVSARERDRLLSMFEGGDNSTFKIISSVRILDEAIDIPRGDSVFITKVGESSSDIRMMQRAMRSGRLDKTNPNKHNNIFLWADGWESCVGALELLRDADPEFHKKVNIIDSDYDRQGNKERCKLIEKESKEFTRWVNMRCLSLMDKHLLRIEECKAFYEKYAEKPIHKGARENESVLSTWISRIRKVNKLQKLSNELKTKIDASLPWFCWDKYLEGYENSLNELAEFYNKYGEPKGGGIRENGNEKILSWWIGTLRKSRKNGKLPHGFEAKVNSSCPWFRWENNLDEKRYKILNDIAKFYSEFNEPPKFEGVRKEGMEKSFAIWLARKRTDKKEGKINVELENKMKEIIPWFKWDPMNEAHIIKINEIVKFYEKNGREPTKNSLSAWMTTRRREKEKDELSPELEALIKEKLPWFSWDPINEQRNELLDKLVEYYKIYGAPTIRGTKDGGNEAILARWVIARRQNKKKGSLPLDFEEKINKLCPWFIWDCDKETLSRYKKTVGELKEFYSKYGRPIAKRNRENGKEAVFVEWINSVKKAKKNAKIEKEIENLINKELPWFIWRNIHETRYDLTIEAIKVFYDKYGEPKCRGKRDNGTEGKLATWLSSKRVTKRKGELDEKQQTEISESLPWFVWEPAEDAFSKSLNDLQEFHQEYGVPKFDGVRNFGKEKEVASWMGSQRQLKKNDKLNKEDEAKIMEVCPWFCWDPLRDIYRTNLDLLKEYYSKSGKEPTPKEKHLYQFILKLRIDKRNEKLTLEEQNEIMTLFPWFRWEANEEKHNRNIELMKAFYNKYGAPKYNGVRENGSEKELYRWICKRREAKKNGQLTPELEKQIHDELPWLNLEPSKSI